MENLKYLLQSLNTPRIIWLPTTCTVQIDNIEEFSGTPQYVNFENFKCFMHQFYKIKSQWSRYYFAKKKCRSFKCNATVFYNFFTNAKENETWRLYQTNIYIKVWKNKTTELASLILIFSTFLYSSNLYTLTFLALMTTKNIRRRFQELTCVEKNTTASHKLTNF